MTKHWNWFNADALGMIRGKYWNVVQAVKIGDTAIKRMMQDELSTFAVDTKECLGEYPTLIGEIGCPYDMVSPDRRVSGVALTSRTTRKRTASSMAEKARATTRCSGGRGTRPCTLWTARTHSTLRSGPTSRTTATNGEIFGKPQLCTPGLS